MEKGKRLATLVGCNYFNTKHELHGCINDVHAMRRSLVTRFGFAPVDVAVLTDEVGSAAVPTGENIKRTLSQMIDRSTGAGDVLFFHYSGHGTTVPSVKPHHGPGRDEAIVPTDFNLITDVDFRQLVNRLPAGASLTIISDSCHSGGLIDKEKEQIGPSTYAPTRSRTSSSKTIPFDSVHAHLATLSGLNSPRVGDHLTGLFGDKASLKYTTGTRSLGEPVSPDNGILLSGCQVNETSADVCTGEVAGAYGAFSYAIQMVLEVERGPISNRELVTCVRSVLHSHGYVQHPCLYCSDKNADAPFLWQPEDLQNMKKQEKNTLHSSI